MKDNIIRRLKYLIRVCRNVREHLIEHKESDLATQIDSIYFGCSILYKILSTYNISFNLTLQCEQFIDKGYGGTISSRRLTERIEGLVEMYDELLKILTARKQ